MREGRFGFLMHQISLERVKNHFQTELPENMDVPFIGILKVGETNQRILRMSRIGLSHRKMYSIW